MERWLRTPTKHTLLLQMVPRYHEAPASQKRGLLDEAVSQTGYSWKYASWLLHHPEQMQPRPRRRRQSRYGPEVQHALFLAWHAANRICSKRLMPFLPTLIEALERHEHLHLSETCRRQLLSMSAATADRLLASQRTRGLHGFSTTTAGPSSSTRSRYGRATTGNRPILVFWKLIWWPIVERTSKEAISPP